MTTPSDAELDQQILDCLQQSMSWDELRNRINKPAAIIAARLNHFTNTKLVKAQVIYSAISSN